MKIIIIGSKGFIGSHCVDYFRKQGYQVIGCDVVESDESDYVSIKKLENNFSFLFSNKDINYCINAAGSASVTYSYQFPEKDFELNVSLVINLLGAIKTNCIHCKFINFSSAAVYGNPALLPIKEDAELKPLSPYGYHKMLSEKLLLEYHRFFNLNTCSLRVFSAYGPGLRKQLFWDIFQKSIHDDNVSLFGTGNESRDFIFISDLVDAVDIVMKKANFCGETINIATGIETTIFSATSSFFAKLYSKKKILFSGETKEGDPANWKADISVLKKFGFKPKVDVNSGVEKYALWLINENKQA